MRVAGVEEENIAIRSWGLRVMVVPGHRSTNSTEHRLKLGHYLHCLTDHKVCYDFTIS